MNVKSTINGQHPIPSACCWRWPWRRRPASCSCDWASGRPIAPARRLGLLVIRLAILAILGLDHHQPRAG